MWRSISGDERDAGIACPNGGDSFVILMLPTPRSLASRCANPTAVVTPDDFRAVPPGRYEAEPAPSARSVAPCATARLRLPDVRYRRAAPLSGAWRNSCEESPDVPWSRVVALTLTLLPPRRYRSAIRPGAPKCRFYGAPNVPADIRLLHSGMRLCRRSARATGDPALPEWEPMAQSVVIPGRGIRSAVPVGPHDGPRCANQEMDGDRP